MVLAAASKVLPNKIVGREGNQRACDRQLFRNVVVSRPVNSIVGLLTCPVN